MTARSALLTLAEEAVNRLLALDERALAGLAPFSGRVLAVDVEGLDWRFQIGFLGRYVQFLETPAAAPDAVVSGPPFSLLRTLAGDPSNAAVTSGRVRISGDLGFVNGLRAVLAGMEVDWEEQLARLIGDVAARPLTRSLADLGAWLGNVRQTLVQDLGEALTEELREVARPAEIREFTTAVDTLRDDTERLEQRVARLRRALGAEAPRGSG